MKKIIFYYKSMNRFGGVERVISNTANALSQYYDITILTKDSLNCNYQLNKDIKIDSLYVMQENSKNRSILNIIKSRKKLKKYIKSNHCDYIYTATIIETLEVFLLGKRYLNKLVATEHGSFFASNKIYMLLRKIIFPKIHQLIAFTTLDYEEYNKLGFPTTYIPHLLQYQSKYHNEVDYSKKENIILNVGRLTNDKQQKNLITLWAEMVKKYNIDNWKLIIVGSGELKQDLEILIQSKHISDFVELYNATPHIEEYYKKASIFAFTSKMEGFGMVLTEAMSYQIPCISFNCPSGPRDIINDGENGFLIPENDYEMYEIRLLTLIKDNALRENMAKNAKLTIEHWDNDLIIKKMLKVFK